MPQQVQQDPSSKIWSYLQSKLGTSSAKPSGLAVGYLRTYLTGVDPLVDGDWPAIGRRFDHLATTNIDPNIITAEDLLSVSFLSVSVPPRAAWAILTSRSTAITKKLAQIPDNVSIDNPKCCLDMYQADSPSQELWDLLRRDENGKLWDMGATKISKVMACKRPLLVPIQDRVVMTELDATDAEYWRMWWQAMHLRENSKPVVADFARELQERVPEAEKLSLLRTLDIVIWMHGTHRS
ncbi:DUF6308 family protein [Arthrobacter sp. AQ5-05]|uniref:DUF6308 family protein n=1 Tax=Arthrobacter sp. AQ5-05 TaxID=2184581 RepID=UPI0012B5B6EB|nr:DUF6308 family protein [Arthrobacter sp. AQ5-05]